MTKYLETKHAKKKDIKQLDDKNVVFEGKDLVNSLLIKQSIYLNCLRSMT